MQPDKAYEILTTDQKVSGSTPDGCATSAARTYREFPRPVQKATFAFLLHFCRLSRSKSPAFGPRCRGFCGVIPTFRRARIAAGRSGVTASRSGDRLAGQPKPVTARYRFRCGSPSAGQGLGLGSGFARIAGGGSVWASKLEGLGVRVPGRRSGSGALKGSL